MASQLDTLDLVVLAFVFAGACDSPSVDLGLN